MIPFLESTVDSLTVTNSKPWQQTLSKGFNNARQLLDYLKIDHKTLPYSIDFNNPFRTRVTDYFADLIDEKDPFDPILLQVIPRLEETESLEGFLKDPLQEDAFTVQPGIIHKYENRALLISTAACAIHCRYCFRRHFPYSEQALSGKQLDNALRYLSDNPQINEVILSGGDPLNLSDQRLAALFEQLSKIDSLKTIRLHTRTPVVLPERITDTLCQHLRSVRQHVVVVLHINHPNEITPTLQTHMTLLRQQGVHLLNQSVLLKDINDCVDTLSELSTQLFNIGVLPYYLHTLDKVANTHHFYVSDDQAQHLWQQLQAKVSGYLLPRLTREIAGKHAKTWINPSDL